MTIGRDTRFDTKLIAVRDADNVDKLWDGSVTDGPRTPNGFQQITSLSSAVGLTAPVGTKLALIQAESKDVRWRDDGTSPTATVGFLIAAGGVLGYTGDFTTIKFIEASASAKLNISYYK